MEHWDLPNGQASVFTDPDRPMARPVVVVADTPAGATGAGRLLADLDGSPYSFLAGLREAGHDVVLVALTGSDTGLDSQAQTVTAAVMRTIATRPGSTPLTVGGVGRGALVARYALATMEYQRIDHQTAVYLSIDGAEPAGDETTRLDGVGSVPRRPRLLATINGVTDDPYRNDPDQSPWDDWVVDAEKGTITERTGTWIVERLPS